MTYINGSQFDLGEFLHEMMAAGIEIYPSCKDQKLCESRQFKEGLTSASDRVGHPGFEALKNIKVSKH